jgi:CRP-like cAMP-binding protein
MHAPAVSILRPTRPWSNRPRVSGFDALRALDLFAALGDGDLMRLAARGTERRAAKDAVLLSEESTGAPSLVVLLEGEATASCGNGDAGDSLIRTLEPGDFFGHLALFGEASCGTLVRAGVAVRTMSWSRDETLRALRETPELALVFLGGMARQQRHLHRRVAGLCNQRAPRRLARALSAMLEDHGIRLKDPEGRRSLLLRELPSRRRIADLAGVARETVSRLLGHWESRGWITESRGDLIILDERQWRRLAGN